MKQAPWIEQRKTLIDEYHAQIKPIDRMSFAEISRMYDENNFLCDVCGKKLGKCNYTLKDHIFHLIHPTFQWSCEDCFQDDLRNDRIIAMEEEPKPEKWQIDYS